MNCQVFLDSCIRLQLTLVKDVSDVKADILIGCMIRSAINI